MALVAAALDAHDHATRLGAILRLLQEPTSKDFAGLDHALSHLHGVAVLADECIGLPRDPKPFEPY